METRLEQYIGGEFRKAVSGRTIGVIDPADESVIREVPYGGAEDARAAVEAAAGAFPAWRGQTASDRARPLLKTAELMRERADDLAALLTREVGKPLPESRGEVLGAAAQFEWYGEEVKRRWGEWIPASAANKRLLTLRQPVGVTAAISAWNFPLLLLSRKLAPALACGCTVIGRPASQTPLATMAMYNCIHQAGFPPGAANLVTGPPHDCADVFLADPRVRKISFTGSVPVGKQLMARAAGRLTRLSLELGGHSPFMVCDDVPVEEAAERAVFGKFRNMGQVCISPSRFFVPESMKAAFERETARLAAALRIGNGLEPDTNVGPLHDALGLAQTEALVADVVSKGGRVLAGGKRPAGERYRRGFWYEPTVVTDVTREMVLMQEEPFAPVLPIIGYHDLDEAVRQANDTEFGLAAYVLTRDLGRAFRLAEALEAGIVGINDPAPAAAQAPFGGIKQSGLGREGGREGIDAYTEIKYISIAL
jgi:succinate-semialdehyde dehydrogenase / glutarate-semialdehyde dehydrogenase